MAVCLGCSGRVGDNKLELETLTEISQMIGQHQDALTADNPAVDD